MKDQDDGNDDTPTLARTFSKGEGKLTGKGKHGLARLSTSGKSNLDKALAKYSSTSLCEEGEDCEAKVWGTSFASGKAEEHCEPVEVTTWWGSCGWGMVPVAHCPLGSGTYEVYCHPVEYVDKECDHGKVLVKWSKHEYVCEHPEQIFKEYGMPHHCPNLPHGWVTFSKTSPSGKEYKAALHDACAHFGKVAVYTCHSPPYWYDSCIDQKELPSNFKDGCYSGEHMFFYASKKDQSNDAAWKCMPEDDMSL